MSNDFGGKKRSELPDNVFGIPQERKYPMPDEKHTRSAIKLFNHVEPKYEEQLAKAIIKNMKKYNIDGSVVGPNNRLRKYLPKDMIKEYVEEACKDLIHARKLCNSVRKLARKYNANYFFVTDGASSYSNGNGKYNPAAKEMRDHMDDWERNNGFNPDDDWTDDINNVSNYRLSKESSIEEEIPKDIRELLRRLNSYDYGYIKNGQKIKGTKNFFEDYKSLTISEFEKYQIGVCWDYVHYEAYWFAKNKYKYETFYIQVQDEDNDCPSHTYLVFYLPNSSKVYYFESSWGKYQGIEAFDNINKLHTAIKERHIESARSKCDPTTYFRNKYDAKSSRWEHLSCGDFMVKVSNGKVQVNESVSSTVSKDHKQKGHIKLSSLKKVRITEYLIDKYKKEYPVLRHVRCKDTDEYVCDGYMWFKDDNLVCYVGSCQYTDDNTKWIVSLEILPEYRGYGLSTQILDFCVKSMKCKYLSVNKNNELAKKIYDKYGFKVYHEDKTMYYMTLDSIIKESSSRKITTVVFDLGDVLIKSNMQEKLRKNPKIPNQQIYPLLEKWFDDDLDLLSKEEYIDTISKRLSPDFSDIVPDIVDAFSDIEVLPYTIPTLKDLKERGYNIYYLSNWSRWGVEILREKNKLDFLSLFDGGLFSYEVGVKKPDRKIYDAFLKKFKINPKEAIFVDNKKKNIDAAKKFGLRGVLFDKLDIGLVYNVLVESSDITTEKFIFGSKVKADMNKIAKEIVKTIKPIVLTSKNKQQASRIGLTLKCEVESLDHNTICILILDGSQDARDSKEARLLLSNIQNDCKSKLVGYVSKITIGDGDEGCLYFIPNKKYIEKNRKDLIQESSEYQIKQSEINDMKTVISSLNDDSFKGFNFKNIAYYDIRYRSEKPIAFITIRTKLINNCMVGYVSLAVDPKYQNQGIGKSLTKKAIQWFKRERGIEFLEWWCLPDNEASNKLANAAGFKEYIARDQSEYIRYTMESSISEYGTTGGTIVGSNQPDSVYIVNYMQNNAFSGHKEPKFGICKKGMKDLHIVGGKYNRFHYVSDLDKFKEEASDIHVYRFKGKPKNEFYDIIEDMTDDNDLDLYKLITGREIKDRSEIRFDGDFIEEECFFDTIDAIKACTEAGLLEASTDLHPIPILTETVQGRPYNYYRDLNGVFIQHEITGLRSKSYETLDDIPEAEKDIVKRGYLV